MRNNIGKILGRLTLASIIYLAGLVMSGEAQAQRFVDNGNGTVTDTVTALMWAKNADPFGQRNWEDAMSACSSYSIGGIGGWRIPTKDELMYLFFAIRGDHPFTGVVRTYWSSTPCGVTTDAAWAAWSDPILSTTYSKTYTFYVWCTRCW